MSNKYGARRVVVDGITFASAKEGRRYQELRLLEQAGEITDLQVQPEFELAPPVVLNGRRKPALRFHGDFSYWENGARVIEDVKGGGATVTEAYRIRKHLMKHEFGIEVRET
jgi:hypothetical protein